MAKQLSKTGIQTGLDIEAHHVTQSVDAFTGIDEYDITLSGSFVISGSSNRTTIIDNQYKVEGSNFTITGSNDTILDVGNLVQINNSGTNHFTFQTTPAPKLAFPSSTIIQGGTGANINIETPSGDITLDSGGEQVYMKNSGADRLTFNLNATPEIVSNGDFTLSGSQDITLDAAGSNITFRSGSTLRYNFLLDSTPQLNTTGGDFTLSGSNDIILNSAGNEIALEVPTGSGYVSFADYSASSKDFKIYPYQTATTMSATNQSLLVEAEGVMTLHKTGTGAMTLRTEGLGDDIVLDSGRSTLNYVETGSGQFIISDWDGQNHLVINPYQTPRFTAGFGGLEFYTTQAVTGIITLSSSADIILDADGSQIYMKDGGVDRLTFNLDATPELDVVGNFKIDSTGDIELEGTDILLDASGDITLSADGDQIKMDDGTTTRFTFNVDSTPRLDFVGDFTISGSDDIYFDTSNDIAMMNGGASRFKFKLDATPQIQVTGDFEITGTGEIGLEGTDILLDASGDITLSADGDQIKMDDGTTTRFTFNVDSTPELDVVGDFKIDGTGDIELEGTDILLDASGKVKFEAAGVASGDGNFQFGVNSTYPDIIAFECYSNAANIRISSSSPATSDTASLNLFNFGDYAVINLSDSAGNLYITNDFGGASDTGTINFGGGNTATSLRMYGKDNTSIESQTGGGLRIDGNLIVGANAYKAGGGSWSATSDSRLKENIITASIDTCYDGVKNLSLKYYKWKEETTQYSQYDQHQLGWIAQDVEAVFPHAVQESDFLTWSTYTGSEAITGSEFNTILQPGERYQDPLAGSELIENRKTLDADQITKMMFGAIQKLQEKVEALEAQISGSN